ncbi:MAG: YcaO-like family protein, partial [Isosphaeraceae bacterium]
PDYSLAWVEGVDLMGGGATWVPYEMVHTDFTEPAAAGAGCFVCGSNGLASGNHMLEAIAHGLCELVERDTINSQAFRHYFMQPAIFQQKPALLFGSMFHDETIYEVQEKRRFGSGGFEGQGPGSAQRWSKATGGIKKTVWFRWI